jgi:hypothetical protein
MPSPNDTHWACCILYYRLELFHGSRGDHLGSVKLHVSCPISITPVFVRFESTRSIVRRAWGRPDVLQQVPNSLVSLRAHSLTQHEAHSLTRLSQNCFSKQKKAASPNKITGSKTVSLSGSTRFTLLSRGRFRVLLWGGQDVIDLGTAQPGFEQGSGVPAGNRARAPQGCTDHSTASTRRKQAHTRKRVPTALPHTYGRDKSNVLTN